MKLHHNFIFNTFDIERLLWQFTTWHTNRAQKMSQNLSQNVQFSGTLFRQQKKRNTKCNQFIHSISRRYFEQ
jgi:hypothetical protein